MWRRQNAASEGRCGVAAKDVVGDGRREGGERVVEWGMEVELGIWVVSALESENAQEGSELCYKNNTK